MTDLGIPGIGDATLIASGGSALVYQARGGTGEALAIKVLRGIRGSEVARRFAREQSATERLQGHPNIIRIHHSGVTEAGEPYLVMPLMTRGSLSDELDNGAFDLHAAVRDVAIAADALEFAHGRGVLHRDLKPANLLRADDGSVIVTDFGIARVVDAGITSATVGASTPLYAAPELLAENQASVRSEVYALGALAYALLNGRPAFSGSENIWATIQRVRSETPAAVPGVPAPVMRVIDQAMAKNPHDRPATADQFGRNLVAASTADPTWQPPSPTAELPRDLVFDDHLLNDAVLKDPAATQVAPPRRVPPPQSSPAPFQPPPAPAIHRPAPVVGPAPRRTSSAPKILGAVAALALIAGLTFWATTRLLSPSSTVDNVVEPPVDNSLPSPTSEAETRNSNDDADDDETDSDSTQGDADPELGNRLVSFNGDFYSAYLPEGWSLVSRDIDEGYGYRSSFRTDDMYLNVDTTPREQRNGGDIAQSARDIASGINSASEVRTEEVDGLVMHSFTFRNLQGVDSIDIFFEVDGDGYAVVAGSATDPTTAFATARLVALSIRSNPDA